jgi:hypothetical protein
VTGIGKKTFKDCTNLTSVKIPDSVWKIGNNAFENCTSLASINIPDGVTVIWRHAFYGCKNITGIHLNHEYPINFSEAFEATDLSKITLFVPIASEKDYRKHPFYSQFGKIVGE